jgi:hypothetical protein
MTATQTLVRITPEEARTFLDELANLSDDPKTVKRFAGKFAHILPRMEESLFLKELLEGSDLPLLVRENLPWTTIGEKRIPLWLVVIRTGIRNIWRAPDIRTREWLVYKLIDAAIIQSIFPASTYPYLWSDSNSMVPMPPPAPFEQALEYLRKHVRRLAYCANSDCFTPFFFSGRSSQKYCSEDCALPFQRACKRRWWAENRKNRIVKRSQK